MLRRTQTHGINLAAAVSVIATFSVLSPLSREADNDTNLGRTSAEEMRRHRPIHFQIGTSRFCTLGSLVDKAFGSLSLKMAYLETPIRRATCEMCHPSDAMSSFSTKSDFAAAIVVDYGGMSFSIIAERRRRPCLFQSSLTQSN